MASLVFLGFWLLFLTLTLVFAVIVSGNINNVIADLA